MSPEQEMYVECLKQGFDNALNPLIKIPESLNTSVRSKMSSYNKDIIEDRYFMEKGGFKQMANNCGIRVTSILEEYFKRRKEVEDYESSPYPHSSHSS